MAKKFSFYLILLSATLSIATGRAFAMEAGTDFGNFSTIAAYTNEIFKWAIPGLGVLGVLMFIYAGYLYITSQGNQENINLAKEIITGTILGLLILFTAGILLHNVIGTQGG